VSICLSTAQTEPDKHRIRPGTILLEAIACPGMADLQPPDIPPHPYGGVHTVDPDGRLLTISTPLEGTTRVTPAHAQDAWSAARERPRQHWSAEYEAKMLTGLVIEWKPALAINCERCRVSLGNYVPYRSDTEYGIVEDTLPAQRAARDHCAQDHCDFRLPSLRAHSQPQPRPARPPTVRHATRRDLPLRARIVFANQATER
jgi:hypothetical protein